MSNGPYGKITCDCGALSLLVCGSPLAIGRDVGGKPVAFWPLEAILIGQGADELDVSPEGRGGETWACRRCEDRLLYADDEAGVAVLAGHPEDISDPEPALTSSVQRRLESLSYRVVSEQ
ncbi:hypothetical protein ACR80S_06130 [Halomonas sp. MA07-2]|uniref:hypothetical protein n=1 Tax=Halomonas sp. MA07-2 TaxID=3440841 RepID=UPI003EF05145